MEKEILLQKYADLAVTIGVNVQKNQLVVINSPVECIEFTRYLVKSAYKKGAKDVMVRFSDDEITKDYYLNVSDDVLKEIPEYLINQNHYIVDNKACLISVKAPTPGLMKDVDPNKVKISNIASSEKLGFFRKHTMSNQTQWLVIAYPTKKWADKVFPNNPENSEELLLNAILKASRVTIDNDPIEEWKKHMDLLSRHNKMLNDYNFKELHFKNSLGTDLTVELVENHIWGGGGEYAKNNVFFAPNIPTEETFTMPHSHKVNGTVVSTKPLNYQGKLIEDFTLEFKDGKVVKYDAKKELSSLKALLELDSGSSRLGEVALISYDSPISDMNILFYNTLFDENASCHLALGNAYTMNMKNSDNMTEEELMSKGYNKSMTHVDFMFGSRDMHIDGKLQDGTIVPIFRNGNFVF